MKRNLLQYLFSIVFLVILIVPIVNTANLGSNENFARSDPAKSPQDNSIVSTDWLTGWSYRKAHQIQGSPGAGVNYQVEILVMFGSGVDSGNKVYCDSNCQPDFDDMRFTDNDGATLLDYWRESYVASDNATFWIEVQDNLDFDASIFVYFGNSEAISASDGNSTFIAWDDFDQGYSVGDAPMSSRGWFVTDNGTGDILEVAPNPSGRGGNGMRYVNVETVEPGMMLQNSFPQESSVALHLKLYWDVRDGQFRYNILDNDDEASSVYSWSNYVVGYDLRYRDSPTTNLLYTPTYELLEDVWYDIESQCESDAHSLIVNNVTLSGTVRLTGDGYDHIYIYGHEDQLDDFYIDDFFIRKFVSSEPTHLRWGELEGEPGDGLNWLTGWEHRKSHEIIGSTGAGTNYQVPIVVNFGSGVDSGNSVYCDSQCQPDFDDIRFTNSGGLTSLDYWRESYYDSDNATFWVEVKDNLDENVTIYIYFGNTACTTTSNGDETFLFFDDFNDGSIDASKWETYGPWTESGGVTSFSIIGDGGTSILPDLMTDGSWDMRNKSIVSRWRVNQMTVNREWGVSCANTIGDDHTRLAYFLALNTSGNDNVRSYFDASAVSGYDYYDLIIGQYPPSVFMTTEFVSTPNNATKNTWILDGEVLDTYSGNSFDSTPQRIFLGFYVHGYTNTLDSGNLEMEFDYVYLRNQVGVDVTHVSWSDTESILEGWNYRISHVINGAAGAGTNYQIEIVVHYGYGTSSGKDVFCEEKCQPDFDDIRFTDNDGVTLLDYWTENVIASNKATFWVEVRDNLDFDTTIYMYFGNSTVSSLSNGTATFMFFDDFESGNFNKWDASTEWSISGTYFTDGAFGAYSSGGAVTPALTHLMNQTESFLISIDARTFDNFNTFPYKMSTDVGAAYPCTFGWTNVLYHTGSYSNWPQNSTLSYDTWYNMEIGFDMSIGKVRGWKSGSYMGEVDFASTTGATPANVTAFRPAGGTQSTRHLALDNVYMRKWISTEPTHGEWEGPTTISWHHNCSNTTGFVFNDSWNMDWDGMDWTITGGTLSSDGATLTITDVPIGTGYHGPVYEHELPNTLRVRDINNFSALFDVDNSLSSYLGYQVVMLGDSDRNPVLYFSFGDGWAGSSQGAYGISYVFPNGSRTGYGSGYPITWTSFNGVMNISYTESGLLGYVEGFGQDWIPGLSEDDFNREIKYVGIASARFGSDPLFPVLVDELYLNHDIVSTPEPAQPSITDVEDFEYEAGTSSNVIEWTVANFTPTSYSLWREGGLLASDVWPGGSSLEINIDNLSPGEYNYTITVFGEGSIEVSDTVIVTVADSTSPSLGHPPDRDYEYGFTGLSVVWTVSDIYPDEYIIYKDGTYHDGDSWTSGSISVSIDGLELGEYNYTIFVDDAFGNVAIDTVIITIVDTTEPVLDHPQDINYEYGSTGHIITWTAIDSHPDEYILYKDGVFVNSYSWVSGQIYLGINGLALGEYNYTIRVFDTIGNSAADTVMVTVVDTTSPILNHPSDITGNIGLASIQITWQPTDLLPFNYVIYQNGTQISSGTWTSGENLTYTLESVTTGSYNITIVVWDTSGNFATDTVIIEIETGSIPGLGDYIVMTISIGSLGAIVIIVGLICRNKGGPKNVSPSSYDW